MKSKMLGALALFTLIGALLVMQSAGTSMPTVDAATGSIDALNVGTCLTTDATVFKGDCEALDDSVEGRDVRDKNTEVTTLYATYAHDPKTGSNREPRAILKDSDLIKISIADPGRDKRSPILVLSSVTISGGDGTGTAAGALAAIQEYLSDDSGVSIVGSDNKGDVTAKANMELVEDDQSFATSGNKTLNFSGSAAATDPMDVKGNIRFFGCTLTADGTVCKVDGDDAGIAEDELQDVSDSIEIDEDASSGENSDANVAPWLGVNVSVATGKTILIYAVYFETSSAEDLVGGTMYCEDEPVPEDLSDCSSTSDDADDVVFTSKEKDSNDALQVEASSDGEDRSANLFLTETERFSGVYQGYLRLTDDKGDGSDADDSERMDWGREVGDGTGDGIDDATVLGVESGPVTITYRDTNGSRQILRIEIDKQPPTISVTSPAHGSSSDDQSPDFAGTIEDIDSGLADKSFRLVIDNEVDSNDMNSDYVLEGKAPTAEGVKGTGADGSGKVTHITEYSGYGDEPFGIVDPVDLYALGRETCGSRALCHITAEEHDDGANRGTFDDSIRLNLQDGAEDAEIRDREYEIDFQAFVLDMAGNIGFSDADPANPRFINALGEDKESDRGHDGDKGSKHNVLGFYSAHVIMLDEKDPEIITARSSTGYFGMDSDDKMIADRSGVAIVFDGAVAANSVSTGTFTVKLDDDSMADVSEVDVDGKYVFLKLSEELASDATPEIDIADGEKVEDMAGNETFGKEQDEFEANDGISPKLTVTLSGGSGSGTGDEGPERLTNDRITVHVSSDEALQNAPRIIVVCSSLRWNEGGTADSSGQVRENAIGSRHDVDDFVANRNGAFEGTPEDADIVTTIPRVSNTDASGESYDYTCGYDVDDDNFEDDFDLVPAPSLSRPGENWEYSWQNKAGARVKLADGTLTAVALARDRSRFENAAGNIVQNWGSASTEFILDTELKSPIDSGDLQPAPDGTSKEARPFVLIEFDDNRTVTLDSVEIDNVEVADQFERPDINRFLYWPRRLSQGDHEVEVEATDAAGNEVSFSYEFELVARGDFVIGLNAGWNAISVPADPTDTSIGSVFTDPAVTTVIGWDTQGWRIAMRRDGVWESNEKYGALNEIRAKYGYWVKSDGFVRQPVELKGGTSRDDAGTPILISIPTEPGWNFVGVVDQDGDQTEDHFDTSLKDSDNTLIPASEYLGSDYVRAYTWDATFSRFDVVRPDHTMTIGDGVWVYYPEGTGIAP